MVAPAVNPSTPHVLARVNLLEYFTLRFYMNEIAISLKDHSGFFKIVLPQGGCARFFNHPDYDGQPGKLRYVRARPGTLTCADVAIDTNCHIGYDLTSNTAVAFDSNEKVVWRSQEVVAFGRIVMVTP